MKSHGSVIFSWQGNVLYIEAFGPFNEEGVRKFKDEYSQIILTTTLSKFSVIELWDEDSLASPEAMAEVANMWALLAQSHCVALALVVSNHLQQFISEKILPENGKVFFLKEEAEAWILNNSHTQKST